MRVGISVIVCAIFGISLLMAACSASDAVYQQPSPQVNASPTPRVEVEPSPSLDSPIRSIDFANFTYPARPIFSGDIESFTLQHGKYQGTDAYNPVNLAYLAYGDVTRDGVEEAFVVLSESIRGTAIPYTVYIYGLQNNGPKLLWSLQTGDRADGGLRQVYAQDGVLVVEQYFNPDTITGECPACPTHFTRTHYEWRGDGFRQKGEKEILTNPTPYSPASPVMQPYRATE
jgi:hypothetical protein